MTANLGALIAITTATAGCASAPVYAPPEHPPPSEYCPVGRVWVCTNHYPSRLERNDGAHEICICREPRDIMY